MKNLLLVLFLLAPVAAYGHPGKIDYRGGHRCWKSCRSWGLEFGEYHLHDKNWKPVRVDKNLKPLEVRETMDSVPESAAEPVRETGVIAPVAEQTPSTGLPVAGRWLIPSFIPLMLILFFILLLLIIMMLIIMKRKKGDRVTPPRP